jgi:putative ABC transport system ATP-binding protein
MTALVELTGLTKALNDPPRVILNGVDLTIEQGEAVAIVGRSGSGKSTLLQCAAGLDRPTEGQVRLAGTDLAGLSETALTTLRRTRVGFVFQAFNLVSALTVRENILLPARLAHHRVDRRWLAEVVARVGLEGRLRHRPAQLSGGEQQRVAIARALAVRPAVIFCDEPTGALDSATAARVLGLLREAVDRDGATVVMVTHDPVAASYSDRVVVLADGRIADDLPAAGTGEIADRLARPGLAPARSGSRSASARGGRGPRVRHRGVERLRRDRVLRGTVFAETAGAVGYPAQGVDPAGLARPWTSA